MKWKLLTKYFLIFISKSLKGEVEAAYKILPNLHFKKFNTTTVFVPTCSRSRSTKFLVHVDKQSPFLHSAILKVRVGDKDKKKVFILDMGRHDIFFLWILLYNEI